MTADKLRFVSSHTRMVELSTAYDPDAPLGGNFRVYLWSSAAVALGCLLLVIASLLVLRRTGNLPPPVVTNNLCFDEKLRWMKTHYPAEPVDLLVMGSSVAWRHFDSKRAIQLGLARNPYNLGFCGLRMSQTLSIAQYFLRKEPFRTPAAAVVIAAPEDFQRCTSPDERIFSDADADKALFSKLGRIELYLKNLDFASLLRNAKVVKMMRSGEAVFDPLKFSPYGDGPLETSRSRHGSEYQEIDRVEPKCFSALKLLAALLEGHGAHMFFVLTPMNPTWVAKYDPNGKVLATVHAKVKDALTPSGATMLDFSRKPEFTEADFTDAIHLRWASATRFTTDIAQAGAAAHSW